MSNAIDLKSTEVSAFDAEGFAKAEKEASELALSAGQAEGKLNNLLSTFSLYDIRTLLSNKKASGAAKAKSQAWDTLVRQCKRIARKRGFTLKTTAGFPLAPIVTRQAPLSNVGTDSDNSEKSETVEVKALGFAQVLALVLNLTEDDQGAILGEIAKSLDLDVSKIKEKAGSVKRPTLIATIKASAKDQGPASLDQVA